MEIKAELIYPYTEEERIHFIVEQNHRNGYEIREVKRTIEEEKEIFEFVDVEKQEPIAFDEETNEPTEYKTIIIQEPLMAVDEETGEEYQVSHLETIEKTVIDYQAWGYTEEEIEEQKREHIDNLELTSADVERAIYEANDMDFNDLVQFVIDSDIVGLDVKRLKIELKANHFVRKHPYINLIGQMLGYTPADMDYLFQNKKFPDKETPSDTQE